MQGEIWKLVSPQMNHFTTEINYQCYFWRSSVAMSDFTETRQSSREDSEWECVAVCLRRNKCGFENEGCHINGEVQVQSYH